MPDVPDTVLIYCKQSDCSFSAGGDIYIEVVDHQATVSPDVAMRVTREWDHLFSEQPFPAEQQVATENIVLSPEDAAAQLAAASIQLETPYANSAEVQAEVAAAEAAAAQSPEQPPTTGDQQESTDGGTN